MPETDDTKHSTYKTRVQQEYMSAFLAAKYGKEVKHLKFIKGGEVSQAYSFDAVDGGYVIRANRHGSEGFEKEKYAFLHFASPKVPIPKIVDIGKMNKVFSYAISKGAPGRAMSSFTKEELIGIGPRMLETMGAIHATSVDNTFGYGYMAPSGMGTSTSWRDYVLSIGGENDKSRNWAGLFQNSFLEKDVFDSLYARLESLIEFCPEVRSLIHGDFGFDNIISDGKSITGVIDWANCMYGDFLYDAAWLSFWPSDFEFDRICREYYSDQGVPNYEKRILCCQLYIALNSMGFYAESDQKDKYIWAKERINKLLKK